MGLLKLMQSRCLSLSTSKLTSFIQIWEVSWRQIPKFPMWSFPLGKTAVCTGSHSICPVEQSVGRCILQRWSAHLWLGIGHDRNCFWLRRYVGMWEEVGGRICTSMGCSNVRGAEEVKVKGWISGDIKKEAGDVWTAESRVVRCKPIENQASSSLLLTEQCLFSLMWAQGAATTPHWAAAVPH